MPRHNSVQSLVDHLNPNRNLPDGAPRDLAVLTAEYRDRVLTYIGDSPETVAGLRKLLEAKDCFIRQAVSERAVAPEPVSPNVDLRDHTLSLDPGMLGSETTVLPGTPAQWPGNPPGMPTVHG